MKTGIVCSLLALTGMAVAVEFEDPVMLKAGDDPIRVSSPGYASPSLSDFDGDGKMELLVGQFASGHIWVFEKQDDGSYTPGEKLKAEGEVAEVPGVW